MFAKTNANGFNILWRYFAWSNQTLSLFAFLAITVWMFENGKKKFAWIPLIPGGALYYSICALVQDNMNLFVDRILHTFILMIAMSAGMLIGMTIVHFITPLRPRRKHPLTKSPQA